MKFELCTINPAAPEMLKPEKNDRSGIGVHYVDACLKPLKAGIPLPDGVKFTARRRGLKITLTLGPAKGDGLMRRLAVSRDPVAMLAAALNEAGAKLGARLSVENGKFWLETSAGGSDGRTRDGTPDSAPVVP